MYKVISLLIMLFCLVQIAPAQPPIEWIRTYDGGRMETFYDFYRVADEGYIACGRISDRMVSRDTTSAIWIVRIDNDGEVIWSELYDRNGVREFAKSIIEADNGDFLAVGYSNGNITALRIDADGEQVWWRNYGERHANAVIELKSGEFLLGGRNGDREGYLICINGNGGNVWDERYAQGVSNELVSIRETDGGVVVAGHFYEELLGWMIWAVKIDPEREGELIWSNTYSIDRVNRCYGLVSAGDDGFLITGYTSDGQHGADHPNVDAFTLKIDENGNQEWSRRYNYDEAERGACIERLPNEGFIIVGWQHGSLPLGIRINPNGIERWHRQYDFEDEDGFIESGLFSSVVIGHDQSILAAGRARLTDQLGSWNGLLVKLETEMLEPIIMYWLPEDTLLTVLLEDSVQFIVRARDQRGQELDYCWIMEEDTLGSDTTTTIQFDSLGLFDVQCQISNDEFTSQVTWHVEVAELYINAYQPDTLNIAVRRNTIIDFSASSRAVEGEEFIEYLWLLDDLEIADNDSVSIVFEHGREHEVEVIASLDDLSDNVVWQVLVNDLIVDYMPHQLELSVPADTSFEFEVFPFDPEDDSLQFSWTLNGDSISDNSWVLVNFDTEGHKRLIVYVADTTESDSLTWEVNVTPNSVYSDEPRHPDTPTLYPPMPNPFNSVTTIRYYLPTASRINLSLFDVQGRLVDAFVEGNKAVGMHNFTLSSGELSSGLYLLRLQTESQIQTEKLLLLR